MNISYGRHPVLQALKNNEDLDSVLILNSLRGEFEKTVRLLCKQNNIPLKVVPKEKLNKLTKNNHQGIIAFSSAIQFHSIKNIIPFVFEKGEIPLILILDGITDVRNFGAIARTAELCGVHAIVNSVKNSAPISPDAIKTSAGALLNIPVCRTSNLMEEIQFIRDSGIQIFATSLEPKKYIFQEDLNQPLAIIIGSEGKGVNNLYLNIADSKIMIPQIGVSNSFNVSVAAGIVLYEVVRQRM